MILIGRPTKSAPVSIRLPLTYKSYEVAFQVTFTVIQAPVLNIVPVGFQKVLITPP